MNKNYNFLIISTIKKFPNPHPNIQHTSTRLKYLLLVPIKGFKPLVV
jgi:hypothetical protein